MFHRKFRRGRGQDGEHHFQVRQPIQKLLELAPSEEPTTFREPKK